MSYTKDEREDIARNILDFMQQDTVEQFHAVQINRRRTNVYRSTRPMKLYDMQRLELVARDVLGMIDHEQLPARIASSTDQAPT